MIAVYSSSRPSFVSFIRIYITSNLCNMFLFFFHLKELTYINIDYFRLTIAHN